MADSRPLTAAGGVVWRDGRSGPEVLLVHRPGHNDWSLPKGKPDAGETPIETAVREVTEETGLHFTVGARLGDVSYPVKGRTKTVTYWSMRLHANQKRDPAPLDDDEIDGLAWCGLEQARKKLTYPQDEQILRSFAKRGRGGASLILVRHAFAGKRSEWSGPDAKRPLDRRGVAQAAAIGRTLPAFGPCEVLSAPLRRCIQTAEPLAAACGQQIELTPLVADAALQDSAKKALKQVKAWARDDVTRIAVSQGNLIDAALDALLGTEPGGHSHPKGSAWVFCAQDRKVVAADFYPTFLPDTSS